MTPTTKELVLAQYRTVQEVSILATSLIAEQHFEAATSVVNKLGTLISDFKEQLEITLTSLELELAEAKTPKPVDPLQLSIECDAAEGKPTEFVGFSHPVEGVPAVESTLAVSEITTEKPVLPV